MDSINPLGTNSIVPRYQGEVLQIRFFQGEVLYNPGLYARTSPNSIVPRRGPRQSWIVREDLSLVQSNSYQGGGWNPPTPDSQNPTGRNPTGGPTQSERGFGLLLKLLDLSLRKNSARKHTDSFQFAKHRKSFSRRIFSEGQIKWFRQ